MGPKFHFAPILPKVRRQEKHFDAIDVAAPRPTKGLAKRSAARKSSRGLATTCELTDDHQVSRPRRGYSIHPEYEDMPTRSRRIPSGLSTNQPRNQGMEGWHTKGHGKASGEKMD